MLRYASAIAKLIAADSDSLPICFLILFSFSCVSSVQVNILRFDAIPMIISDDDILMNKCVDNRHMRLC